MYEHKSFDIDGDYHIAEAMVKYAKENCKSYVNITLDKRNNWYYCFQFTDKEDLVAFTLRWP